MTEYERRGCVKTHITPRKTEERTMIKEILKPIIEEAYAEGYKKGAEDVVHRMAYIYDVCRERGKADGYAEAGAINIIDIEELTKEEWEKYDA